MFSTEIKIDGERLWETIHDTAKWGAIPDSTGMCRLSCSDEDKAVREWFVQQTAELGCTHKAGVACEEVTDHVDR
jgi:beta-ureidopropionase / N-carbamoyl-L-amino-acid hydrolase